MGQEIYGDVCKGRVSPRKQLQIGPVQRDLDKLTAIQFPLTWSSRATPTDVPIAKEVASILAAGLHDACERIGARLILPVRQDC